MLGAEKMRRPWTAAGFLFGVVAGLSQGAMAQAPPAASLVATGDNTSFAKAQVVDVATVNSDTVHQSGSNFSLATAQPVSPLYFPFGSPTAAVNGGDSIGSTWTGFSDRILQLLRCSGRDLQLQVNPTGHGPGGLALSLFDSAHTFFATADGNTTNPLGSVIDFTTLPGASNPYVLEVSSGNGVTSETPYSLLLQLPFSGTAGFTTNVIGARADPSDPTNLGLYRFSANAGDALTMTLNALQIPTPTELELFDPDQNLVAVAEQNASDELGSLINFTVPDGSTGTWYAEALSPSGVPFAYDLAIEGATSFGSVNPRPALPSTPIPEPASGSVLMAGVLAIVFRYRSGQRAVKRLGYLTSPHPATGGPDSPAEYRSHCPRTAASRPPCAA